MQVFLIQIISWINITVSLDENICASVKFYVQGDKEALAVGRFAERLTTLNKSEEND